MKKFFIPLLAIMLCGVGNGICGAEPEPLDVDEEDPTDIYAIPLDTSEEDEEDNAEEARQIQESFAKEQASKKAESPKS